MPRTLTGFLGRQVRARPFGFIGFFALVISAAGTAVAVQYGMKLLVDAMSGGKAGHHNAYWALLFFLVLIGVESALWRASGVIGSRTIIAAGVKIRLDLFRHLAGHSMRYFNENFSGSLGHRITATAGHFGSLISTCAWNITPPLIDFLGALIIFASIRPPMAAALAGSVAVVAGGVYVFGRAGRLKHRSFAESANRAGGELVDVVGNMALVKAFRAAGAERRRLSSIFKSEAARQCESWFFLEKTRIFHDLVLWAGAGAMLYWAISLWTAGELTPGDVVVISALTFRVLHGARDLALAGTGMSNDLAFIAETLATIGAPHQVQDAPDAKPLTAEQGMIEFRNVTFRHRSEQPLFEDFSLSIRAGERIGIAGHSGSGKSTLIGLLQRLYDPQHGQILIDGQPIQRVTQESLHAAVAVVPQDCTLFHRSILENIRYGRPEASDAEVMAAARAAHCDGFISGLPQGYETVVGERGATLSGGQRQRIAVARVLLSTAKIVLLDEATSAMDTVLERDVYRSLERVLRGKTVIVVAHRLATVANCDRIVVLDAGQIAEQGAPAELTTKHGAYAAFLRPQPAA